MIKYIELDGRQTLAKIHLLTLDILARDNSYSNKLMDLLSAKKQIEYQIALLSEKKNNPIPGWLTLIQNTYADIIKIDPGTNKVVEDQRIYSDLATAIESIGKIQKNTHYTFIVRVPGDPIPPQKLTISFDDEGNIL